MENVNAWEEPVLEKSEYPGFLFCILWTILITDFGSGCCPSREVATIETLIKPSRFSSVIAPIISSASGSTSALTLLTASSTSKSLRSFPPVILTSKPLAPFNV